MIRHFIHSGVFQEIERACTVQYVFPKGTKRLATDVRTLNLGDIREVPVDELRVARLRHLSKIQTLHRAWTTPRLRFIRAQWKEFFSPYMYRQMMLYSLPGLFQWYRRKIIREAGRYPEMERAIEDFRPDVIIHPSVLEGLFISDLCEICERHQIPLLALMNSWDNPSSKAMVVRKPSSLYVWGEQTKRHAIEFMQMDPARVHVFGAAQFDVFREPLRIPRERFLRDCGLDPAKQIILYAGSSKSVNEMNHLIALDEAISSGALAGAEVIFRPHPWRAVAPDEPDFYDLQLKHVKMDPGMVPFYNSPKRHPEGKIHLTDYRDTHQILGCVDLMCANASTIMIEAALHAVPVLCMISDEDQKKSGFLRVTFDSVYFQELLTGLDIPLVRETKHLPFACKEAISMYRSTAARDQLRKKASYFVEVFDQSYSSRLYDEVKRFAGWEEVRSDSSLDSDAEMR